MKHFRHILIATLSVMAIGLGPRAQAEIFCSKGGAENGWSIFTNAFLEGTRLGSTADREGRLLIQNSPGVKCSSDSAFAGDKIRSC
jgi:hypothetical protein